MYTPCLSLLTIVVMTCLTLNSVSAGGQKGYHEECSMLSQISNVFTQDKNDEPNACNTDKGLICAGNKCECTPGKAYEKGLFGTGLFGQGKCVGAANRPCLPSEDSDRCVSNAECTGQGIGLCVCKEGYHAASDGHCSNGAFRASNAGFSFTSLTLLALIPSLVAFFKI